MKKILNGNGRAYEICLFHNKKDTASYIKANAKVSNIEALRLNNFEEGSFILMTEYDYSNVSLQHLYFSKDKEFSIRVFNQMSHISLRCNVIPSTLLDDAIAEVRR